jgi:hypothetical protein
VCTTSSPFDLEREQPIAKSDIDPNVQWFTVISRKLGDLNIIVAGEVDCIKGTSYQAALAESYALMKGSTRVSRTHTWN